MKNNAETQTSSDNEETLRSPHRPLVPHTSLISRRLPAIFCAIIIIIGGIVCYLSFTDAISSPSQEKEIQKMQNEWSNLCTTLDKPFFESSMSKMDHLFKKCEENNKQTEQLQSIISTISILLKNLKNIATLFNAFKDRQDAADKQLLASENFPQEWENIQILENEATVALNQEDFLSVINKLETGLRQLDVLEKSLKNLKETVSEQIVDIKQSIHELETNNVEERMPNEWNYFKTKYLSNDGRQIKAEIQYRNGYYRRSKEICEDLSRELEQIRTQLDDFSKVNQKELLNQTKKEEIDITSKTLEQLQMSLRMVSKLNVQNNDFFKLRFRRLELEANAFEEMKNQKSPVEMGDEANKLIHRINKLITEINKQAKLQRQAEAEYKAFTNTMEDLEKVKNLWDENIKGKWVKCLEVKQEYWQLFEDFNFSTALKVCKEQQNIIEPIYQNIIERAAKEARELHRKASDLVRRVKEDIQPEPDERLAVNECIRLFNEGSEKINQKEYSSSYEIFNKAILKINGYMLNHFQTGCARLQAQEKWQALQNLAGQWLHYEGQNKDALKYRDIADWNINHQKIISDFKEANTKGNLERMQEILDNWSNRMQRNGENPNNDDDFGKANQLYNKLIGLKKSQEEKDWQRALNDSIGLQQSNDWGKESRYVMDTIDLCVKELLDKAKANAIQSISLDQRHSGWRQVVDETASILRHLPENTLAKQIRENALVNLTILQKAKDVQNTCYQIVKNEKQYAVLSRRLAEAMANYKTIFENNEVLKGLGDIQVMEDIQIKCNVLQELSDRWEIVKQDHSKANEIRNQVIKLADEIILPDDGKCAFAEECKRRIGQSKRTLQLPGGGRMTFIAVQPNNGKTFWMGECEVSQGQYDTSLVYVKNHLDELKGGNTWFGGEVSDIVSFLKKMNTFGKTRNENLPAHSIGWDEAFAWCEMLNLYSWQHDNPFREYNYVFRLPKVDEWREAYTQVALYNRSGILSSVFDQAPNELGFRGLFDNVSEWSIDNMNKSRYLWIPPQGFLTNKKTLSIKRAVIGGSWKKGSSAEVFAENAGSIIMNFIGGNETRRLTPEYSQGTKEPYIGFRIIWGPKIPTN